ncbi:MarR family winged helix-turn-helix transcriptional regulator [Actinomycetospora soli]|uniref:MarR family winged helix-turn-helix transcriptional regulator n=1 Tax=Actinomycetospora soli TaxID=2893887 RepID=UPI001E2B0717|nr:MarR family winged helix-turn-helix transcriptional regulator [Actinomycetospora soli]MCD2187647.1 MarR family winged helix-turn-helix transcriptional regulator [Actinomycetospora soli]
MSEEHPPPRPPWGAELEAENLEFALSVLDQLVPTVVQLHRADAARLGLDPTELTILEVLRGVAPLSIAALAGRCALSHAATARAVDRLVAADRVGRYVDPDDARGWLVDLPDHTVAALRHARATLRHDLADLAAGLTPAGRVATLHALVQVTGVVMRSVQEQAVERCRQTRHRRWLEHRERADGGR